MAVCNKSIIFDCTDHPHRLARFWSERMRFARQLDNPTALGGL